MALILGFVLGGAGVVVVLVLAGIDLRASRPTAHGRPPEGASVRPEPPHIALPSEERARSQPPRRDDEARPLRAQDAHLEALARRGTDANAMRALVSVRRKRAGDNPAVLRRQALLFRQTAAEGRSLGGYTPMALLVLAEADERAAAEIDGKHSRIRVVTETVVSETRVNQRQVVSYAAPAATPAPAPRIARARPSPTGRRASARAPAQEGETLYVLRLGPISLLDRATRVVGELRADGLSAAVVKGNEPREFRVVSARLALAAAEHRRTALVSLGHRPTLRKLSGGLAQVVLGPFSSRARAEAVAAEIRRGGSYVTVAAEGGTGHTIVVGPYRKSAISSVMDRISARFGVDAALTVRPAD